MRYFRFLFLMVIIVAVLSSCGGSTTTAPTTAGTPVLSAGARAYLTAVLNIMQQHSVNRKKINWTELRQEAFTDANGAKTPADTYFTIQLIIGKLGDHHSFFLDPQQAKQMGTGSLTSEEEPQGQLLTHGVGYLQLPSFEGSDQAAKNYVMLAQNAIRTADQGGTCGWVVDLRNNPGGDMWPMLDGVGPILGDGIVGSFVGPEGGKQFWGYFNGQAQLAGTTVIAADSPYHLKHTMPPVAVLTGPNTASSGEAIVVAFRDRASTRSFGEPTSGVPTANATFTLSNGAVLVLTEALDADRSGQTYDSAIPPDQPVSFASSQIGTSGDAALQAATTWLHKQEGC